MEDKKKALYDALSGEFDLGSFESFSSNIEDDTNRRNLYDAIKDSYDVGDYDSFSAKLTSEPINPVNTVIEQASGIPYPGKETDKSQYTFTGEQLGLENPAESPEGDEHRYTGIGKDYKIEPVYEPQFKKDGILGQSTEDYMADVQKNLDARKKDYNQLRQEQGIRAGRQDVVKDGDRYYTPGGSYDNYLKAGHEVDMAKEYNGVSMREIAEYYSLDENKRADYAKSVGRTPEEIEKAYESKEKGDINNQMSDLYRRIDAGIRGVNQKKSALQSQYEKERGFGGFIKDALMSGSEAELPVLQGQLPGSALEGSREWQNLDKQEKVLWASARQFNTAQKMINAAKSGDFFTGMGDALQDLVLGGSAQDMQDLAAINEVSRKFEKGEKLTAEEEMLLESIAMNVAVASQYQEELSAWYNAGKMTGEMIPYMVEMWMNPLSKLGKKFGQKVLDRAKEKYGKDLAKHLVSTKIKTGVAKLGGAALGGYGMSLTTGLPSVVTGVQKRTLGDAVVDKEMSGDIKYAGRRDAEGLGTAIYKETTQKMLDNASEMLGAGYLGKPFSWLQKAGKDTRLLGWIDNVANSKFGKILNDFMEKTNWHGPLEEFMEEIHVGILEPMLVGDTPWGKFFTGKNLATIAIGVSVPGVAMATAATLQGAKDGAFKAGAKEKWKMERGELRGIEAWGPKWEEVKQKLDSNSLDDVDKVLTEIHNDKTLTPEQKVSAFEYGIYGLQYRTARGVVDAFDSRKDMLSEMLRDVYAQAYSTEPTGEATIQAINNYQEATKRVMDTFQLSEEQEIDDMLADNSIETLANGDSQVADMLYDYKMRKAYFEGAQERFLDTLEEQFAQSDKSIDSRANKDNPTAIYSTMYNGEQVDITGGNVVLFENGKIDYDNSSETLYVTFPDNTVKPVSAKNFTEVVTVENAEELKAAGRAEIDNRWRSEFDNAERVIDEGKKRKEGKLFNTSDELGEHTVEVLEEGETESRILLDGKEYPISTEELNQWRNEAGVVPSNTDVETAGASAPVVNEVAPIPMEKRGNVERAAYHLVPIERTMEDLHDGQLDQNEVQELINARIKEAHNDVQALEKKKPKEPKKPKMEGSKEAYLAAKAQAKEEFDKAQTQWQASMDEAKQRLDYYNELYAREQEITKSEIKEAYDNVQPREVIEMTADEFIANNLPKITPESFKAETGLSNSEQAEMVGYIAGADKGGVTVEQAAESIMENYGDELRSLGYSGDMQDVRDTIINILSQGNPRSYAKQGLAQRKQESIDQQRAEMETAAASLGFKSVEDMSAYEEQVIPGIIQMYTGFDYNEYYNNLAENYEYDTTRESETTGRGSELLQGEQSIDNAGTPVAEGNEGGAVSSSVPSNGTNAQASGNEQVTEPVGNSEQLSSSEIPNNQSVAEGEDVSPVEESNPLANHAENIAKRLGVNVTLHTDASTVADRDAMTAIAEGGVIKGWYNPNTGEIALFLPNMESMRDVESTILHEAVSHYGIKKLLGKEEFNKFLDAVWEMMPADARAQFLEYVGADMKNPSQRNMRAAADEYVAHIAERMELSEVEKSIWDRILDFILARLRETGFANLDRGDIENVIKASYRNLARNGGSSQVAGQGETMARKKMSERRKEKNRINNAIDTVVGFIYGNKEYAKKRRLKMESDRKELAKEMYASVLKGDFNDVTLSQIDKYIEDATPFNPFGRRISQRLPQRMERALRAYERTNAVDALFSRISESAVPANERFSEAGRREIEERKKELLKGWAIATGNWHTDLKEFTDDTEPIGEGQDSKVYSAKEGPFVIKVSKGKPYGKRFRPDIDNIVLFNDVFRNSRYEILGYGEIDGDFVRILKQRAVDFSNSTPLTVEERVEYMRSLGFEPINKDNTAFSNGEIVIADLQKSNIVRDVEGDIRVIDADAKLHTKDVGGDYTYPPAEDDLPEDSGTRLRKVGNTENNSIFASIYKTEDGKDINYTSERTEGYGVQDDGIGNSNSGSRRSILQRQTDTGVPGANSGLDVEKGEFCVVERVFTENGAFNFTSGEKIESADDVAYIFSALEDAAKEHSFVVYVKDGMPTVIELGMGSFNATMVDIPTASLAYSRINPDHVYFVHNHPSGNLICSSQDVAMLRVFEDMSDVPVTGVIINLKTGKYGTFDTERHSVIGEKRVPEKEERLAVHTLDKQIFAPDYDPMAQPLVRGSQDVAQFLNSQRMGDRPKVSFLILSRANRIIGNIHTPFTNITTDVEAVARYINERVIQFGGENVILYGDFAITSVEGMDFRLLQNAMDRFGKTKLLDVVRVEGNFTRSANDMGLLYEPEAEYKDGQTMFRRGDIPEVEQQRAKQQMLELIQPFAKEKREEEIRFKKAYHGSGADFERFDHSFMNSGEGAQAFGYGTYVTAHEATAYRYGLRGKVRTKKGNLYEVEIPESGYIQWDEDVNADELRSLYEALPREKVEAVLPEEFKGMDLADGISAWSESIFPGESTKAEKVYRNISYILGSDKAASEFLNKQGYTGIAYEADGAKNYVIFNEDDAQITEHTRFSKNMRDVERVINEFNRTHKEALPVRIVQNFDNWKDEFREFGVKEDEISRFEERIKEGSGRPKGAYLPDADIIVIFDHSLKGRDLEGALWHENMHKAIRRDNRFNMDVAENVVKTYLPNDYKEFIDFLENIGYHGLNAYEEALCQIVQSLHLNGGLSRKGIKGTGVVQEYLNPLIVKIYGYGKEYGTTFREIEGDLQGINEGEIQGGLPDDSVIGGVQTTAGEEETRFSREVEEAKSTLNVLAEKLNSPINVVEDISTLPEKERSKKGWMDKEGNVSVVLDNHISTEDVAETVLHEVVGKRGLHSVMGESFDEMLDDVYENTTPQTKRAVNSIFLKSLRNGFGMTIRECTEEYLAELAERGFDGYNNLWNTVKQVVRDSFYELTGIEVSDNEIRYLLWKNRNRLKNGPVETILDRAMEARTDTGNGSTMFRRVSTGGVGERYDRRVEGVWNKFKEGWYDATRSMRVAQEEIEMETGKAISDSANIYDYANHLPSINRNKMERFDIDYIQPFLKFLKGVRDIALQSGEKLNEQTLGRYANAKHGIERNREMSVRKALTEVQDGKKVFNDTAYREWQEKKKAILANGESWMEQQDKLDALAGTYGAKIRDYSGLTAIFDAEKKKKYADVRKTAVDLVLEVEGKIDSKAFWEHVNNINGYSLKENYESGLMSKKDYENISSMYEYYVPLRGHKDTMAEDVYEYVEEKKSNLNGVVKTAHGRTSEAKDIFATMLNMANSAIVFGSKNRFKQRLLNLALMNRTPLLSVGEAWYIKAGEEYIPAYPNIDEKMTSEEIAAEYERFEQEMKNLENQGLAEKHRQGLNLKYAPEENWTKNQHAVSVKRNGKEYIVYVNGSPKLAQAVNGLLLENDSNWFLNSIDRVNQWRAKTVTGYSPSFVVRNLVRDFQSASVAYNARHGAAAMWEFDKNVSKLTPQMHYLYNLYKKNELDESNKTHRYFKEFLENGGETGYTEMISIEEYQKKIKKYAHGASLGDYSKAPIKAVAEVVEFANRGVENICRFAAYKTSREAGMSILKSINDAKEVSVNFNRKGSGAYGQATAKRLYMFLNPAIQAMVQRIELSKKFPKRMAAVYATEFAIGAAMPTLFTLLYSLLGGDDDEAMGNYYNLTNFKRRSNICLPLGDGVICIPLAHESRVAFGLGEMFASYIMGHTEYDNVGVDIFNTLTQSLPINPVEGVNPGDNIAETIKLNLAPDAIKPFVEIGVNKDFAGNTIHNASDFNKHYPEHERGKRGAGTLFALLSETLSGEYSRNRIDDALGEVITPSSLEHLAKGYLGGLYTFANEAVKTAQWMAGDEEFAEFKNIPIANGFYTSLEKYESKPTEERTRRDWEKAYKFYAGEIALDDGTEKNYKRHIKEGDSVAESEYNSMIERGESLRIDIFNDGREIISALYDEINTARDAKDFKKVEELDKQIYTQKRFVVERMEQLRDDPMSGYTMLRMKTDDAYGVRETYGDVRDVNVINDFQKTIKPVDGVFKSEKAKGLYKKLDRMESAISKMKKRMEKPENAEHYMTKIRETRAQAIELINNYRNE